MTEKQRGLPAVENTPPCPPCKEPKHAGGRPRKYQSVEQMSYDWGDFRTLSPVDAIANICQDSTPYFSSERTYRKWFVDNVLRSLSPYIADGGKIDTIEQDVRVIGSRLRIDVLATTDNGYILGLELKSVNPRHPQCHASEMVKGIGQTLLYEDYLCEYYGQRARVFLVSDTVTDRVASLVMRRGYLVNLIEANHATITCMAREEIGRG